MGIFRFAYFDEYLEVSIPDNRLIPKLESTKTLPVSDVYKETIKAFTSPIGVLPLKDNVGRKSRVLITVPDKSRHTDIREVLRAVLDELLNAGVQNENITILIALGTHRAMTKEEIAEKIGARVAQEYKVVNHDYDDPSSLIDLGKTSDGLPAEFNRLVIDHDYIISIGNITVHPVGGYSGGAKGLLPGIAGRQSTDYFHWEATKYPLFDIFGNPDNPVRHEMEQIVGKVGLDFIVNTTENSDQEISGIFAGHFIDAHRSGVKFLQSSPLMAFPTELSDILVVGLGNDRPDFWAGAAGIYAAAALLKEGGTLVLFAACPEGVAPEHPVVREYGYPRWKELIDLVENGTIAEKTGASHVVTVGKIIDGKDLKVMLVSQGISKTDTETLGFQYFEDPQKAVDEAIERMRSNARVLIYERI